MRDVRTKDGGVARSRQMSITCIVTAKVDTREQVGIVLEADLGEKKVAVKEVMNDDTQAIKVEET